MAQQRSQSCLGRLLISVITFIITTMVGGVIVFGLKLIYPILNPVFHNLLIANQVPRVEDITYAFWALLPCGFSLPGALVLSLLTNRIVAGRKNTKEEAQS